MKLKVFVLLFFIALMALPLFPSFAQRPEGQMDIPTLRERFLKAQTEYAEALASGDSVDMMDKAYVLGKRYYDFGDYFEGRKWLHKALKLSNSCTGPLEFGKIYGRFALCEEREQDWGAYMDFVRLSLSFYLKSGNYNYIVGGYHSLGRGHLLAWRESQKGVKIPFEPSLDSALWYNSKAMSMAKSHTNRVMEAVILSAYGEILSEKGQTKEALTYMKSALKEFETEGLTGYNNNIGTSSLIAQVYLKDRDLANAKKWVLKAYQMTDTANASMPHVSKVKELLGEYYALAGDWQAAYKAKAEAQEIQEQEKKAYIRGSSEVGDLLREKELQLLELEASRRELKFQEEKAQIQAQLRQLAVLAAVLAALAGVFFFRLYKRYKRVSIENARLVREQSHRVKNNLQSINDLLSVQMVGLSDPLARAALEESMNRVGAIARVHQSLYQEDRLTAIDLQRFIPDLVKGVLRSYNLTHVDQRYHIGKVWLHADEAIPLGLILSELVTNSCKYALGGDTPSLTVSCAVSDDDIVNFSLSDNGPGFARDGQAPSFGLRLVELLTSQLKGNFSFIPENGTVVRLSFRARKLEGQVTLF